MRTIHYSLHREDGDYVAQCIDFDVSSFGATREEAIANLREAVELYLEDLPTDKTGPIISETCVGEFAVA
ncbi:MAG: type II toxin-antitoxin system HicB family antitoxin [Verrucomicrobiae bacterium]|nr:type II toxin-antitoxin system HicB family antitoxin [Verrucomicrobiae bacterium]